MEYHHIPYGKKTKNAGTDRANKKGQNKKDYILNVILFRCEVAMPHWRVLRLLFLYIINYILTGKKTILVYYNIYIMSTVFLYFDYITNWDFKKLRFY